MVSNVGQADNGQTTPTARGGSALPKLNWRQWDMLAWCDDQCGEGFIAVTPGRPPRVVWRAHEYFRKPYQVKPLLDLGLLEYVRTEVYANGASCEVYTISKAGRAAIEARYERARNARRDQDEARQVKHESEQRATERTILRAALVEQYGYERHISDVYRDVLDKQYPFANVPLPSIAPRFNGHPITIHEYLLTLWASILDDDDKQKIDTFLRWASVIDPTDAIAMIQEHLGIDAPDDEPPTYGSIGWKDGDDE